MEDPYLRERETDVADVAGRLRMNLRHGGAGLRELLKRARRPVGPDRRRADARRSPRSWTGRACRGLPWTPAAARITPPSWRAR